MRSESHFHAEHRDHVRFCGRGPLCDRMLAVFNYCAAFHSFESFSCSTVLKPPRKDEQTARRHTALAVIKWQHISKLWIFNVTKVSVSHLLQYCVWELNAEQCVITA